MPLPPARLPLEEVQQTEAELSTSHRKGEIIRIHYSRIRKAKMVLNVLKLLVAEG